MLTVRHKKKMIFAEMVSCDARREMLTGASSSHVTNVLSKEVTTCQATGVYDNVVSVHSSQVYPVTVEVTVEVTCWSYREIEYLVEDASGVVYDVDKYENDGALVEIGCRVPNTPDGKFLAWIPDHLWSKELMAFHPSRGYEDVVSVHSIQVSPVPSFEDDDDDTVEVSRWTYLEIEYLVDDASGVVYDADKYENDGALVEMGCRVPNTSDGKFVDCLMNQ